MRCFIVIAFELCLRICCYEGSSNTRGEKLDGTHQLLVNADSANLSGRMYIP
jgi:hypothetical protein